jgi:hypothetical protein
MSLLKPLVERSAGLRQWTVTPSALTLPAFSATIAVSAFLLFAVQPMFTKMVIPSLGGTPTVWSVAIVFFQAILLAGYGYAHLLIRHLSLQTAILLHLGLAVVVTGLALPIAFDASWGHPPADGQALWLIFVFSLCVGLPFFAVSANGPLLQAWYATTGRPDAHDPYFLYRASNIGSFLALLAYPFLVEPNLTLRSQSAAWSAGFIVLALGIATCGWVALSGDRRVGSETRSEDAAVPAHVSASLTLTWMGLAFVPSALLIAVTSHITADLAAVPLLWIFPLALYLLSFIFAFSVRGAWLTARLLAVQPILIGILALVWLVHSNWLLILHLAIFFISATICHGRLYEMRPDARRLSSFYLYLSLGGVLGGAFATLLAPSLFNTVVEYPILIVAALACRPRFVEDVKAYGARMVALAAAAGAAALVAAGATSVFMLLPVWLVLLCLGLLGAFMALSRERPARLLFAAVLLFGIVHLIESGRTVIERDRSFFGVHTVSASFDGRVHRLVHGNTIHGVERFHDEAGQPLRTRPEPAAYFQPNGVFAQAINSARAAQGGKLARVGVIGLGMGALACHAQAGESWSFFEIDPAVVRIARDRRFFRSLSVCAPDAIVIIGDGRLMLAEAAGTFDLIVVDAFSSDSVPVHLLTREALALYAAKLGPSGAVVFNISNRHMELDAVVAMSAAENGLVAMAALDAIKPDLEKTLVAPAHVAIAARLPAHLGAVTGSAEWRVPVPGTGDRVWTDDYSNILTPILRKHRAH